MSQPAVGNSLTEMFQAIKDSLNAPGTLSPCPFCGVPRHQRSDYVRCQPCGVNWLAGEDLNKDPRNARMAAFIANARAHSLEKPRRV